MWVNPNFLESRQNETFPAVIVTLNIMGWEGETDRLLLLRKIRTLQQRDEMMDLHLQLPSLQWLQNPTVANCQRLYVLTHDLFFSVYFLIFDI